MSGGQFDLGPALRDVAMHRVDEAADDDWKALADKAIAQIAATSKRFTADDVWGLLDEQGVDRPREARALGPRMMAAARDGLIVSTDEFRKSTRAELHACPRRVWRSRSTTNRKAQK